MRRRCPSRHLRTSCSPGLLATLDASMHRSTPLTSSASSKYGLRIETQTMPSRRTLRCLKQLRLQHNSSMAQTDHHSCREELMHGKFKFVTTREGNYSRTMVRARSLSFDSEMHYRYLQTFASD